MFRVAMIVVLVGLAPVSLRAADPPPGDIVIRKVTIHDGSGKPGQVGDLHIKGDRIVAIGTVPKIPNAQEIDGTGLIAAPGFIDLHTHCDYGLLNDGGRPNKNYITQGCTTVITGNCGSGPVDVAKFYTQLGSKGTGTNVIHLVPHNDVRQKVMGNVNRLPTSAEQEQMEKLVEQGMKDGAWGLATGLIYNPGTYAKTEEIIGLAKMAARHHGIYASHIRDEGSGLLTAIDEAIRIGKEAGLPVHVSHIKASGKGTWGKSTDAVARIEKARAERQVVTADQYPYIASSTSLRATLVPSRFREGKDAEYVARWDDPKTGPDLRKAVESALGGRDGGERIQIARYARTPAWQGKTIAAIARKEDRPAIDIVAEIETHGGASVVNFAMNEEDVRVYMKRDWVATASDGGVQTPGDTVPHPRSYGTFPRKIGAYALKDGIITLEQAIRSSSGLPADILRLKDRGYLRPGYHADVVIFDPATYKDTATFEKPHQYASGVKWVFVNGVAVVADGAHQPKLLPGRPLKPATTP